MQDPVRWSQRLLRMPLLWSIVIALAVTATAGSFLYPLPNRPYEFQLTLTSSAPGVARLYFNRNLGFGEAESSRQNLKAGANLLRLPVPADTISALRLVLLVGEGSLGIGDARITGPGGLTAHRAPARSFLPNEQIMDVPTKGAVREMMIPQGAITPELLLSFHPELSLPDGVLARFLSAPVALSLWFVATLLGCLALVKPSRHLVNRVRRGKANTRAALGARLLWPLATATLVATAAGWRLPEPEYAFHVELTSSAAGFAQIYYDRGPGLSERDSSRQDVVAGTNRLRLPIPPGEISTLRFDPLTSGGRFALGEVRITGPGGWIVRRIPACEFEPNEQLEDLVQADGQRELVAKPDANDPQLVAIFNPRMRLPDNPVQRFLTAPWTLSGWFFLGFVTVATLQFGWHTRNRWAPPTIRFAQLHPRLSIAVCAIVAGVTSSYPVVFFGRSFISPNNGGVLLYDGMPMVPGVSDPTPEVVRGADIGAMMWAHMPYTVVQSNALYNDGTIPLWNRYNSCGLPLLGQGQSMIGEPLNFLVVLAGAASWAFDFKYVLCKILFACGLGWCVWLITRDLAASLLIAFAGAFIAFFNYRVNHPGIFSMSYSPWILVAWLQLIHGRHQRNTWYSCGLWLLANWMVLNSGTVKESYALIAALNLTGAITFLVAPRALNWKLRAGGLMMLAAVGLVLAAAPVWWTMFDSLASGRTIYDAPGVSQIPRAWLVGFFDDLFYLELSPRHLIYAPAANFLILFGCLWAIVQPRRLIRDVNAAVLLFGFMLAISIAFTWMPASWILAVPRLRNIHHLGVHFSCAAIVQAAVLAGWGFSAARRPLQNFQAFWKLVAIALLLAALVLAFFLARPNLMASERSLDSWIGAIRQHAVLYAHLVLFPLALAGLTWTAARYLRRRTLTAGMIFISVTSLAILLGRHGQHLFVGNATSFLRAPGPRADLLADSAATTFLRGRVAREPARIMGTGHNLLAGFMSVYGFESINGPDAVFNPQLRELLTTADMVPSYDWHVYLAPQKVAASQPMLDFLNVRYIGTRPGTKLEGARHRRIAALDLDIYESDTVWPRAFFTNRLSSYHTTADFVDLVRTGHPGEPFAAIQAADGSAPDTRSESVESPLTAVSATSYNASSNTTAFTIVAPGPGYAVLHENWFPHDFRASINGVPTPYFRVNHVFKGVTIPQAGIYHISFTYWPRHFTASLILCGIGLACIAGLLWFIRRYPDLAEGNASQITSPRHGPSE